MLVSSSEAARLHPDRGRGSAEPAGGGGGGGGQAGMAPCRRGSRLRCQLDSCGTVDHAGGCAAGNGSNGWIDYVAGHGRSTRYSIRALMARSSKVNWIEFLQRHAVVISDALGTWVWTTRPGYLLAESIGSIWCILWKHLSLDTGTSSLISLLLLLGFYFVSISVYESLSEIAFIIGF